MSGQRRLENAYQKYRVVSFSPLTGILYVRTMWQPNMTDTLRMSFSPLTGILYVRTPNLNAYKDTMCVVSVP